MNMKKLIQTMTDIEQGNRKRSLKESYAAECGDMEGMSAPMPAPMAAPENPGNPVTASITLNASGMEHVADLMRLLQQAGLEKAGPVAPPTMPMRADMERLRDKMNGLESSSLEDDVRESDIEEYTNEPDEEYRDHNYMLNDLAGGLNKPKKMYKPAAKGDNPMAVETIKDRLYNALSEKKAKPDYLDFDGDGDRKEPMKKALADKKKKTPVKESEEDLEYAKKYLRHLQRTDASSAKIEAQRKKIADLEKKKGSVKEAELDEISKKTLGSYLKKATNQAVGSAYKHGKRDDDPSFDKTIKRAKGMSKAVDKLTKETALDEISSDLAKRYTKAAKMDRDFNDDDIARLAKSGQSTRDMHKRNAKRTKGIYRAKSRIENEANYLQAETELKDFKSKAVPGLYNFNHFEAPDGSFIQVSPHGHGVYQDADGNRHDFNNMAELKQMFNKATEAEVQEGAPPLSPKFIKQLQITFSDKPMLSPRETRKVEDMIDKISIENIKQLVAANIPHISDMAKQYIRNNTPGGMKQEAEVQAPSHELSDTARKATNMAQMIKRKINSGEQMDDRDYNQMAELGHVLSRFGASFGPKSMKDVLDHMVQYTNDRNEEGHGYPEFNVNRFKELLAMAK